MSKSTLYATNNASQTVTSTGTYVNFGNMVRRYGCETIENGNLIVKGQGYYSVDVKLVYTSAGAETINVLVYQDGLPVPGAIATETIGASETVTINIPFIIRTYDCCASNVTVSISGGSGTITNASIVSVKE